MKKIILLGFIVLTAFNCKAQVIPVEEVIDYFDNVEEGETTYIKDVNNVFDDYVGTWTGTINNKDYVFIISKSTVVFDEEYNINQDVLLMRYLITDSTFSTVIEDTRTATDDNVPCTGMLFRQFSGENLAYEFSYIGTEESKVTCGQNGSVFVTLRNDNTQLYLLLYPGVVYSDCETGQVEQILPVDGVLLTKE